MQPELPSAARTRSPDSGSPDGTRDVITVALEQVRTALRGLAFGTVTITVQDGVVVQIDRTEKLRIAKR